MRGGGIRLQEWRGTEGKVGRGRTREGVRSALGAPPLQAPFSIASPGAAFSPHTRAASYRSPQQKTSSTAFNKRRKLPRRRGAGGRLSGVGQQLHPSTHTPPAPTSRAPCPLYCCSAAAGATSSPTLKRRNATISTPPGTATPFSFSPLSSIFCTLAPSSASTYGCSGRTVSP